MPKVSAGVKRPPVEPEVEPEGNWVHSPPNRKRRAGEMSEACLMERSMSLLRGVRSDVHTFGRCPCIVFDQEIVRAVDLTQSGIRKAAEALRAPG